MEKWFHDSHNKLEVINARPQIAKVLRSLQQFFPRNTNTNGYNLPKMHGITKMQEYMKLVGSGINFHGKCSSPRPLQSPCQFLQFRSQFH